MIEKRKNKRLPLKLELTISSLFKQDYELLPDVNTHIEIVDISKSGLGFICTHELPINYYFDTKIQLSDDNYFFAVLKILRVEKREDKFFVGCEFVGLADILSQRVDKYDEDLSHKE